MSDFAIRLAGDRDRDAIRTVELSAFGGPVEAGLVDALVASQDVVIELVAEHQGTVIGHVLFSRLGVVMKGKRFDAVALAPLAVSPDWQGRGVGTALTNVAHEELSKAGEKLSIVLGEPGFYGRFGYKHERAAHFESAWQCEALQALAWQPAPETGVLVYAAAFEAL